MELLPSCQLDSETHIFNLAAKVDFSFLCIRRASFIGSLQRYLHLMSNASSSQMWISGLLGPHQDSVFNSTNSTFFLSVLDNKSNYLIHVQLHPLKDKERMIKMCLAKTFFKEEPQQRFPGLHCWNLSSSKSIYYANIVQTLSENWEEENNSWLMF